MIALDIENILASVVIITISVLIIRLSHEIWFNVDGGDIMILIKSVIYDR